MKKGLFILAVFVMAFGNAGFAQHKANLKSSATQNVLKHYGVREETSMVPETAMLYDTDPGFTIRVNYIYDEYDYYLIKESVDWDYGDGWKDYYQIIYEYDFNGNVIEVLTMYVSDETGEMENFSRSSYTYDNNMLSEVVFQYWRNDDWENITKEVYTYNDDVTTVLYWDWNGNNWTSDELYTYTYSNESIELIIQYMEGGAWQNDERVIYTLDFDENVTEIVYAEWTGSTWENVMRKVYNYEGGVYVSMIQEDWNNGSWDSHYKYNYVYENGNATYGECFNVTGGGSFPASDFLEMAYGYNAEVKTFACHRAEMTYIDLTGVKENCQANFKVYPVPAENEVFIQADGFQKAEIYSVTGQKLMESTTEKMNVSALSSGLYIIKVYDLDGNSEMQRFVVK